MSMENAVGRTILTAVMTLDGRYSMIRHLSACAEVRTSPAPALAPELHSLRSKRSGTAVERR